MTASNSKGNICMETITYLRHLLKTNWLLVATQAADCSEFLIRHLKQIKNCPPNHCFNVSQLLICYCPPANHQNKNLIFRVVPHTTIKHTISNTIIISKCEPITKGFSVILCKVIWSLHAYKI